MFIYHRLNESYLWWLGPVHNSLYLPKSRFLSAVNFCDRSITHTPLLALRWWILLLIVSRIGVFWNLLGVWHPCCWQKLVFCFETEYENIAVNCHTKSDHRARNKTTHLHHQDVEIRWHQPPFAVSTPPDSYSCVIIGAPDSDDSSPQQATMPATAALPAFPVALLLPGARLHPAFCQSRNLDKPFPVGESWMERGPQPPTSSSRGWPHLCMTVTLCQLE